MYWAGLLLPVQIELTRVRESEKVRKKERWVTDREKREREGNKKIVK
jgi:hypothetical protein